MIQHQQVNHVDLNYGTAPASKLYQLKPKVCLLGTVGDEDRPKPYLLGTAEDEDRPKPYLLATAQDEDRSKPYLLEQQKMRTDQDPTCWNSRR